MVDIFNKVNDMKLQFRAWKPYPNSISKPLFSSNFDGFCFFDILLLLFFSESSEPAI